MRYEYLFANGCSFVYGENAGQYLGVGRKNDQHLRFSKLLSDKLNVEEINLGKNGESNHYIVRTTFDWVEENKDKVKNTVFTIGITEPLRLEFWLDSIQNYQAASMRWVSSVINNPGNHTPHQLTNSISEMIPRLFGTNTVDPQKGLEWYEMYLRYFYTYEQEEKVTERLYKLLNSHIKSYGGTLILFNSIYDSIKDKAPFNFYNFPHELNCWKSYNRLRQDQGENWKTDCTHPSHLSHAWFSDQLYEFITQLNE